MKDRFLSLIRQFAKSFWGVLSRNLGLKVLSLVFAVLLWSYVVSSNPSITRTKTINGIDAYMTNNSVLNAYGLALADDPTSALQDVTVVIEVSQASYALANAENVQVTLDLSSVRTAGTQEVALKAATTYGKVQRILPETITLNFEPLDSRSVPINADFTGERQNGMWYNIARINPGELVISGASSIVQSITSAYAYTDVTGRDSSFVTAVRYILADQEGNEIPQNLLTRSSSSVTVSVDVYPTKELPISTEIANVIKGQVAEGYEITDITIQPETITVAAEDELLEGLAELMIEPIAINNADQSFSQRARISSLADIKNVSAEQVYVNVTIQEESISVLMNDVTLSFIGMSDDLTMTWVREVYTVRATGPRSKVEALRESGINAMVDLSGLDEGDYKLPLTVSAEVYPDLSFEFDPANVTVSLTKASND